MKEKQKIQDLKNFVPTKPNKLLYPLLILVGRILGKIWINAKFKKDPAIKDRKGPFVCVGTHSCIMDVAMMMLTMSPVSLNIVCGRDVMTWNVLKPFAKAIGLLPINQFEMDLASIRSMKRAVDSGCSLALFPEGKFTLDGRGMYYIPESLAKLLKLLKADVVFCHNNGGYCARPRWYSGFKYGTVVNESTLLFTKEQLAQLSDKEIYDVLKEKFKFNDCLYQRENNLRFKAKNPAEGLHYILYKCPKCGEEYEMVSDAHYLTCEKCGNKVEFTEYGELIPQGDSVAFERIDLWYEYEREAVRKEIANDNFEMRHPVVWERADENHNYVELGEGEFFLNHEYIGFVGKRYDNGEEVLIQVPTLKQPTIVHKNSEAIDLTIDTIVNRFYFKEVKYSCKYNIAVEELYRKNKNLPID